MTGHGCTPQRTRAGASCPRRPVRRSDVERTDLDVLKKILTDKASAAKWAELQHAVLHCAYRMYVGYADGEVDRCDLADAFVAVGLMGTEMRLMDRFLTGVERRLNNERDE